MQWPWSASGYADFGPTLACEKLRELHAVTVSAETLRSWMTAAGLWSTRAERRKRPQPPRARRDCVGELVQIGGCEHDWFEGRGPRCTLLVYVDDATGRLMELRFARTESTFDYFASTERYLRRHGKPIAFYSDKHSIFRVNRKEAIGGVGFTQFGRAMRDLNIDVICANSPAAKGRVERAHQTLQDRLVKELRLNGINATVNLAIAAICHLFATLNRPEVMAGIRLVRDHRSPPDVLTVGEVQCLLAAATTVKHRAMFTLLYGAGLRVSELLALRPEDIDHKHKCMRVRHHGTDADARTVPLSQQMLAMLRDHVGARRTDEPWLFAGRATGSQMTRVGVSEAMRSCARATGLTKKVRPHLLRRSFAAHLLDLGTDLRTIQALLGIGAAGARRVRERTVRTRPVRKRIDVPTASR